MGQPTEDNFSLGKATKYHPTNVLDKFVMYFVILSLFFGTGLVLGVGTINYFKHSFFPKDLGYVGTTRVNIWGAGSIAFYMAITSLVLGAIYLFHQKQRRWSATEYKSARWAFWTDCGFTALNVACYCVGIYLGLLSALIYISYALEPSAQ